MSNNQSTDFAFHREILDDIAEVNTEVQVLKRDIQNLQSMYGKIENSIVKLDSASSKLDVLMVGQEKTLANIDLMIRERDNKFMKSIDDLRIAGEAKFREEIIDRKSALSEINSRISVECSERRTDIQDISMKIGSLDRFRWLVVGALTLISAAIPIAIKILT